MAERKTTKTREEAIEETLNTIRQRYSSDIDSINSKIDYAISDGNFSVFIDYVPNNDVQIYFRDGFNYTIKPKVQSPDRNQSNSSDFQVREEVYKEVQGIEISWFKTLALQPIEIKIDNENTR